MLFDRTVLAVGCVNYHPAPAPRYDKFESCQGLRSRPRRLGGGGAALRQLLRNLFVLIINTLSAIL